MQVNLGLNASNWRLGYVPHNSLHRLSGGLGVLRRRIQTGQKPPGFRILAKFDATRVQKPSDQVSYGDAISSDSDAETISAATKRRRRLRRSKPVTSQPKETPGAQYMLDSAAYEFHWNACTVRGQEDGSLIYKFDEMDPLEEDLLPLSTSAQRATNGTTSRSKNCPTELPSWGTVSIKLGVKFPKQITRSIGKLDRFVADYASQGGHVEDQLDFRLFKSYTQALRKRQRLLFGEESDAAELGLDDNNQVAGEEHVIREDVVEQTIDEASAENSNRSGLAVRQHVAIVDRGELTVAMDTAPFMTESEMKTPTPPTKTEIESDTASITSVDGLELIEQQEEAQLEKKAVGHRQLKHESLSLADRHTGQTTRTRKNLPRVTSLDLAFFISNTRNWILKFISWLSNGILRAALLCYRLLPYSMRGPFHGDWPPQLTAHASPKINALLANKSYINKATIEAAGFDSAGFISEPLHDVARWQLEMLVGCGIRNVDLYRRALTHTTALPLELRTVLSYERLEFLGDAVLELCTRQLLFQRAPDADEGELTMMNQPLVSGETLHEYARWLGLDKWLAMNIYSLRDDLAKAPAVLADVFEALIGALYLDKGYDAALGFILRVFQGCPACEWQELVAATDYKGALSRTATALKRSQPKYVVKSANMKTYRDTALKRKYWVVHLVWDGEVVGIGSSFNKRAAEQQAAVQALSQLNETQKKYNVEVSV